MEINLEHQKLNQEISNFFIGKKVEIICPIYNGQLYGRSKKPLKGKVFVIHDAYIDNGRLYFYNNTLDDPILDKKCKLKEAEND